MNIKEKERKEEVSNKWREGGGRKGGKEEGMKKEKEERKK